MFPPLVAGMPHTFSTYASSLPSLLNRSLISRQQPPRAATLRERSQGRPARGGRCSAGALVGPCPWRARAHHTRLRLGRLWFHYTPCLPFGRARFGPDFSFAHLRLSHAFQVAPAQAVRPAVRLRTHLCAPPQAALPQARARPHAAQRCAGALLPANAHCFAGTCRPPIPFCGPLHAAHSIPRPAARAASSGYPALCGLSWGFRLRAAPVPPSECLAPAHVLPTAFLSPPARPPPSSRPSMRHAQPCHRPGPRHHPSTAPGLEHCHMPRHDSPRQASSLHPHSTHTPIARHAQPTHSTLGTGQAQA